MGFIKAAFGSAGGQLADQWKEFFVCDALDADVLMAKGHKKETNRSSNKKGEENIITQGSVITVADGQCVLCVEQGAIVDVVAEPGEFTWDSEAQPSIFTGSLGASIKESFMEMGKRFGFGGQPGCDQRIYYFNTKELIGNKYGTASPIPFRIVDKNIGLDMDITVRCNGEYSYCIADPLKFYKGVAGNAADEYRRDQLDSQLKTELLTALQPAFGRLSLMGIRYSEIPLHTTELCDILNEELSEKWFNLRGLKMVSFGINAITTSEENERALADLQRGAVLRDPNMAAAQLAYATTDSMRTAAANEGGAMNGFIGMGMANAMGTSQVSQLFDQGAQQAQQAQQAQMLASQQMQAEQMRAQQMAQGGMAGAAGWTCTCGAQSTGNFCPNCGKPKDDTWTCSCGNQNKGNFCSNCGAAKQ